MIKRTKSKDLLAQSIEQLAASKSVNKIRIKDITENCGLTSPMFYYYYKDADDIINYIFRTDFEKKLENGPDRMDYEWLLHRLADLLREKYGFYQNVLQNTHGVNSLYNTSASVILEYIREKMRADFENGEIPPNLDMMLEFHIYGVRTKACDLMTAGYQEDLDDLLDIFVAALPADLKPYLLKG